MANCRSKRAALGLEDRVLVSGYWLGCGHLLNPLVFPFWFDLMMFAICYREGFARTGLQTWSVVFGQCLGRGVVYYGILCLPALGAFGRWRGPRILLANSCIHRNFVVCDAHKTKVGKGCSLVLLALSTFWRACLI